jgi:hypothetical protein
MSADKKHFCVKERGRNPAFITNAATTVKKNWLLMV